MQDFPASPVDPHLRVGWSGLSCPDALCPTRYWAGSMQWLLGKCYECVAYVVAAREMIDRAAIAKTRLRLSPNRRSQKRAPQRTMILNIRTPKMDPLIAGNTQIDNTSQQKGLRGTSQDAFKDGRAFKG